MTSKPGDPPLLNSEGRRTDGRNIDEVRPIKMQVNVLSRADGSAYVEQGGNKILAAVYGPREIHPRHLSLPDRTRLRANYRMASFSVDERKHPAPSRREIELSKVITDALTPAIFVENFPRTAIDIYIEVIQADGGTRCASINAASLALADAGIPMRDLVVACAIGKVSGKMALDLNNIEDQKGEADIPIAMMPRSRQITLLQMDGRLTVEEINRAYELFLKGAEIINMHQREALRTEFGNIDFAVGEESSVSSEMTSEPEENRKKVGKPNEEEPVENCACNEEEEAVKEDEHNEL